MKENLLCQFWQDCFKPQFYSLALRKLNLWRCKAICHLKYGCHTRHQMHHVEFISASKKAAFSLVEMLMALLVASLLLAALAPVMTKKMNESIGISVQGTMVPETKIKNHTITYDDCLNNGGVEKTETDSSGNIISRYCEGIFIVPAGFNGVMTVTAIGAGGGGGSAATAGYTEFTTAGSTNTFKVPLMTNKIEATLVSGGAGGGAGGQVRVNHTFVTSGNGNVTTNATNLLTVNSQGLPSWDPPAIARGKYYLVTACGGGGGGGGSSDHSGGNGGIGGYFLNRVSPTQAPANGTIEVRLGGGGGGGGADNGRGRDGRQWDGGAGGSGVNYRAKSGNDPVVARFGGYMIDDYYSYGGEGGTASGFNGNNGVNAPPATIAKGGAGSPAGGGAGGDSPGNSSDAGSGAGGGGGGEYMGGGGGGGAGGSGGGGGGQTTLSPFHGISTMTAGGGGGGGGGAVSNWTYNFGGGGGGGGGRGGGRGGNAGGTGQSGFAGGNGSGAITSTVFGTNYCQGGAGAAGGYYTGGDGKDGALRISYLSYGTGGSGGGASSIVPIQPVKVREQEALSIKIGVGDPGGAKGYIGSDGNIVTPGKPPQHTSSRTEIKNTAGANLLTVVGGAEWCPHSGHSSGQIYGWGASPFYGHTGAVYDGITRSNINVSGFSSEMGRSANNGTTQGNITFANGSSGGDGGKLITPFTPRCSGNTGGTASSPTGKTATQGYGCGGGGGYGLADGGAGSGGYARISWNKYWDVNRNEYSLNNIGAGGGGAAGNIMTYDIRVSSGERIRYRIGKGGEGAVVISVSSATLNESKKGGDTIFAYGTNKAVKAGGGYGGKSPSVSNPDNPSTSMLNNGIGGSVSGMCTYNTLSSMRACSSSIKTNCCTKAAGGKNPTAIKGGNGETLNSYGTGGAAKEAGRGDTNGNNATGTGSGGAGASLRDVDRLSNPSDSIAGHPTGGNGSNGMIMLKWEE